MDSKSSDGSTSPPRARVKKENEEIKDFAETAMNELLGWYGYERLEMRRWAARACTPDRSPDAKDKDECSWCGKGVAESSALRQGGGGGAAFCSELCFSQSRRANFKRAKTCDWCRHVRHTVAYVDFQDGAVQLQFCSDKCLIQYKMHIFRRETQAHLDLNPHLVNTSSTSNLITPELWLKDCKSRSPTPHSELSKSPAATQTEKMEETRQSRSPVPVLTVTPTSKLLIRRPPDDKPRVKSPEAKRENKVTKMNLRRRRVPKTAATQIKSAANKPQDLRIHTPIDTSSQTSTVNSAVLSPPQAAHIPLSPSHNKNSSFPSSIFMDDHIARNYATTSTGIYPPRYYPTRPTLPMNRFPPPFPIPQPLVGQPPPVTVLVPYPVIVPIPLPIPIPLPTTAFVQAYSNIKDEPKPDVLEVPLDFTMNGANNKEDIITVESGAQSSKENQYDDDKSSRSLDINCEDTSATVDGRLSKLKISRVGNKISKVVTKAIESQESSRPLRKRRLVEMSSDEDSIIATARKYVEV